VLAAWSQVLSSNLLIFSSASEVRSCRRPSPINTSLFRTSRTMSQSSGFFLNHDRNLSAVFAQDFGTENHNADRVDVQAVLVMNKELNVD
jgi:hypothetical protein